MITRASHTLLNLSNERLNLNETSMHSSRMRTASLLTIPTVSEEGGAVRGVSARGGICPVGVSAPLHAGIHPPVNRMTDRCKNITLPQTSFVGGTNITACANVIALTSFFQP